MHDPSNKYLQSQIQTPLISRTPSTKFIQTLNVERLQKYILAVQNHQLKKELQLYDWRQKTDFPIVKIDTFQILQEKLQKTRLQLIINSCHSKITQLKDLKIQDVTLLIKQAFIGFERLFNKFKPFQVKPDMIIIDQKNNCRVWINSNFSLNQVEHELKDFSTGFKTIIDIFETITLKSPISNQFYLDLKKCNCFIKGLKHIETFVKNNRFKPCQKPNFLKKISSSPNLIMQNLNQRLSPIDEEKNNMRQTIGYLRKKQQLDFKNTHQAMTFAGKNTHPLQKSLQQMIQLIPKNQIAQKNSLLLGKFKEKPVDHGENLKKVFKNVKDFKFLKPKDEQKPTVEKNNCIIQCLKEDEKPLDKFKSQTARNDFEKGPRRNYEFVLKKAPLPKNIQQFGRFSVTQTRCTQFFNHSGDRFGQQQNSIHSSKKFSNIKFSEISHKKNSEMSDFNKDIENILFGIDGHDKPRDLGQKKDILEENIATKSLHMNCIRSQHNISILDHEETKIEHMKKTSFTKTFQLNQCSPSINKSQPTDVSATAKYGAIDDQIEEPTAEQISQKYIELGWKNTLNVLNFGEQVSGMKESIHAGDDHRFGLGELRVPEKKPVMLGKLDRIKNKQLVQSVMNEDFFGQ